MRQLLPFLLVIMLLFACSEKQKTETMEDFDFSTEPDVVIYNFTDYASKMGKKNWELKAKIAEKYEELKKIVLHDIVLTMYKNDKVDTILTAKLGIINYSNRNISVHSNVVVNSIDNLKLYTESLLWDNNENKLKTDDFVKIVKENGDVITGYGLEASRDFSEVAIKHKVRGKFHK